MRAYTLSEIDRMRDALIKLRPAPRYTAQYPDSEVAREDMRMIEMWGKNIEDTLRTHMSGGVEPAELEAKLAEAVVR
jgi:hypothetical protein